MGPLGIPELIIIFVVALIVFGPRKLPELGRSLGKSLSEFKRASNELRSTLDEEIRSEDRRATPVVTPAAAPVAPVMGSDASNVFESHDTDDGVTAPNDTVARGDSRV